jgi:DNA-binding NtrC family response regulator
MQTLSEVYERLRARVGATAQERRPEPIGSFEELLRRDSGPLYGVSHDIYHAKRVWIPDCARSGLDLLILGESGTGKELIAGLVRQVAQQEAGRELPLVRVDCEALAPETFLASLCGQAESEFTNLPAGGRGWLGQGAGGFVLFDEIGALEDWMLGRLLQIMERRQYRPLGATEPRPVEARVLATTNRIDRLRSDLLWRFPEQIHIQPLRRRRLDIFFLLHGLLDRHPLLEAGRGLEWLLTPTTLLNLLFSRWRGNVGQLCNAVDTAAARYRKAPPEMPRFFTCRPGPDDPAVLTQTMPRYDLWRHLAALVRDSGERGRELVPAEPPDRSEVTDHAVLRSLGSEETVPCFNLAEALEFATLAYEALDEDNPAYECAEARVYTVEAAHPPLPPALRWLYDEEGDRVRPAERWGADFTGLSAEEAYRAYLVALRERCGTMTEAAEKSGLSDTTLRRHFKEHGIRQYKGKRPAR